MKYIKENALLFVSLPTIIILIIAGVLLLTTLLTSCANEKKFVHFHDKQPAKAIGYCIEWNPTKDSVHESVSYLQGEPEIIPGETIYANCDSVILATLDEAAKSGTIKDKELANLKWIIAEHSKRVAVPCPQATVTVDTFIRNKFIQVRYTEVEDALRAKLNQANDRADTNHKWAVGEGWVIAILLLLIGVYGYAKISNRV